MFDNRVCPRFRWINTSFSALEAYRSIPHFWTHPYYACMWRSGFESWVNSFRMFQMILEPRTYNFWVPLSCPSSGHHPMTQVMDEYDSCRPAFMKLDIKRKSYGPAMILGEARSCCCTCNYTYNCIKLYVIICNYVTVII